MSTVLVEEQQETVSPMTEGMLSLQEVMEYLNLDKAGVEGLVKKDRLNAYKIGGVYLRFKKDQVIDLMKLLVKETPQDNPKFEKLRDFWAYNNFYIIAILHYHGSMFVNTSLLCITVTIWISLIF